MISVVGKITEHMAGKLERHKCVELWYQNKLTSAGDDDTWKRVPVYKCAMAPRGVSEYELQYSLIIMQMITVSKHQGLL